MGPETIDRRRSLARCRGFRAVAADGPLGKVEAPLFPPDGGAPDYLVIRTAGLLQRRRPVVAADLVEEVDPRRRIVYLRGSKKRISRLPEELPLAI